MLVRAPSASGMDPAQRNDWYKREPGTLAGDELGHFYHTSRGEWIRLCFIGRLGTAVTLVQERRSRCWSNTSSPVRRMYHIFDWHELPSGLRCPWFLDIHVQRGDGSIQICRK